MIIPHLAPQTEVLFTDPDGEEKPAWVVATIAPGQFRLATDEEGKHTVQAGYASEATPMTFRFPPTAKEPAAQPGAPKKPVAFKPGADAPAAAPEPRPAA